MSLDWLRSALSVSAGFSIKFDFACHWKVNSESC